ncbi:hypothetical protein DXU07_24205 [Bradyrhizobium elkanii]
MRRWSSNAKHAVQRYVLEFKAAQKQKRLSWRSRAQGSPRANSSPGTNRWRAFHGGTVARAIYCASWVRKSRSAGRTEWATASSWLLTQGGERRT